MNDATGKAAVPATPARRALLLTLLIFLAPVLIGGGLYIFGWRPATTNNHGELIVPPRPLAIADLGETPRERIAGKWLLLIAGDAPCDSACVALAEQSRAIAEHHADLGEVAAEDEALDDVEELGLVVELGLEIRRVDRHQTLGARRDAVERRAHLLQRTDHGHRLRRRRRRGRERRCRVHRLGQDREFEFAGSFQARTTVGARNGRAGEDVRPVGGVGGVEPVTFRCRL